MKFLLTWLETRRGWMIVTLLILGLGTGWIWISAAAALAIFWGLAHLAEGDAFGSPSSIPWSIQLWGAQRHPTQIYEITLAGLVLAGILWARSRMNIPGTTFLTWVSLAAVSRLFLEAFRGDSVIILSTIRAAQVVSLGILLGAILALHLLLSQHAQE